MKHQTPALICGYCNAARDPGTTCPCPDARSAAQRRSREIERRLDAQRSGVAALDPKIRSRAEWRF